MTKIKFKNEYFYKIKIRELDYTKEQIEKLIIASLKQNKDNLQEQFSKATHLIGYFILDDLLPTDLVRLIYNAFPKSHEMVLKKNIREFKYVGCQMNEYDAILEDVIYAFQSKEVVREIGAICGLEAVIPDRSLHRGGISLMKKNNFLNPHLDNSHNRKRNLWRVLNLLYYVTPNWKLEDGGNLELWSEGIKNTATTIESSSNRLVVMATHQNSWHSVSKVKSERFRCCISNYYFSTQPQTPEDSFHVTTFRGRPSEKIKDSLFQLDNFLRATLRKVFKEGITRDKHLYKK